MRETRAAAAAAASFWLTAASLGTNLESPLHPSYWQAPKPAAYPPAARASMLRFFQGKQLPMSERLRDFGFSESSVQTWGQHTAEFGRVSGCQKHDDDMTRSKSSLKVFSACTGLVTQTTFLSQDEFFAYVKLDSKLVFCGPCL